MTGSEEKAQGRIRWLSDLWEEIGHDDTPFDVVIVGSGYGASVAAATLAGTLLPKEKARPLRICVLERGRQYLPGEFPSRFSDLPGHLRVGRQNAGLSGGKEEGLFDVRLGDDVNVLLANGLGGGSLINAGVLLEPDPNDFKPGTWKNLLVALKAQGFYDQALHALGGAVRRSDAMLRNDIKRHQIEAANAPGLPKLKALGVLAQKSNRTVVTPPLSVSMDGLANSSGVELPACNLCGDCMTGCNVGAKDSLDVNLLEKARRAGAEIYLGTTVLHLERSKPKRDGEERCWEVFVAHTDDRLEAREEQHGKKWGRRNNARSLKARHVILGAGSLGSTEILLRSRTDLLTFSPLLGASFSCNGDNLAAVHRMAGPAHCRADENQPLDQRNVGPTITGTIGTPLGTRSVQYQEFSVPGPMARLFDEIVTTANALDALSLGDRERHGNEPDDQIDPLAVDPAKMENTLLVGIIGHDDARGVLELAQPFPKFLPHPGTVRIRWHHARHAHMLEAAHNQLADMTKNLDQGASLVANPMWRLLPPALEDMVSQPRGPVLTVHPLGGCALGASKTDGVVDARGRVFDVNNMNEDPWFGTLHVLDGAIIPGSLGVNPALSISAVALHAAQALRRSLLQSQGDAGAQDLVPEHPAEPLCPPVSVTYPRPVRLPLRNPPPPPSKRETQISVIERLTGPMVLDLEGRAGNYVVELTLAYLPSELKNLTSRLKRVVNVNDKDPRSQLRIFAADEWEEQNLRVKSTEERDDYVLFEAQTSGTLAFLHREASTTWGRIGRGLWAWVRNRGLRDIYQTLSKRWGDQGDAPLNPLAGTGRGLHAYLCGLLDLASRAGEVRRFDYHLTIASPRTNKLFKTPTTITGGALHGSKRLTYNRRANPWCQLTEMRVESLELGGGPKPRGFPVLKLDTRFFANQGVPLIALERQQDQAAALLDLLSFGLQFLRVILHIHLWTFRKPDTPDLPNPDPGARLPGPLAGLPIPVVEELNVGSGTRGGASRIVKVRLTRYPNEGSANPALVMIHGYSVSGTTFAHPSLAPSAAEYFWKKGRDVWIVDLRTSSGLSTASENWAFEEPALIDIPAALLHVRRATGQPVDVLAHCIGCAMLSMAILTDGRSVRGSEIQLGDYTFLTREQLGILDAFNGGERAGGPHPCIRSVVLSQKGPVLRYTDDNILRAYLMQTLRRWLMSPNYQFRPLDQATVADQLVDRLLASLPYPAEDYDVENPLWPWKRTPWVTTRHRMDALYGRDFNAANMSDPVLRAIDDLFGPLNLDTVAQTVHFTRFNAITNQQGRGEFVTRRRLRERWRGIPTLAIHGAENGLVDVDTQRLLREHFRDAGVDFQDQEPYEGMGHQDVLIGKRSNEVFATIEGFLAMTHAGSPPVPPASNACELWILEVPWIGPRLDFKPAEVGNALELSLAAMSRPDQGRATLCLVPVRRHGAKGSLSYQVIDQLKCVAAGKRGASGDWCFVTPPLDAYADALGGEMDKADGVWGWLALFVAHVDETTSLRSTGPIPQGTPPPKKGAVGAGARQPLVRPRELDDSQWYSGHLDLKVPALFDLESSESKPLELMHVDLELDDAHEDFLPCLLDLARAEIRRMTQEELAFAFVSASDLARAVAARCETPEPAKTLDVFVGSCQYPAGLLDRPIAEASLRRLCKELNAIDLGLFVGDQIYADATAGLMDPTRRDELYELPNEKTFRVRPMREILRRVPVEMLLDDHELVDNWEPSLPRSGETRRNGFWAYWKYQRTHGPQQCVPKGPVDFQSIWNGRPVYFLDTRLGRSRDAASAPGHAADIIQRRQWIRLKKWLWNHKDQPKLVVSPSVLLPRRRTTSAYRFGYERSDAWDGFPRSLERLLRYIAKVKVRNTVFISGDEHHSFHAEICLQPADVKIVSVHCSALYAPFPFANGEPTDLVEKESFQAGGQKVSVDVRFAPPGDGYVRLTLKGLNPTATLEIRFAKADESGCGETVGPITLR